MTPDERVNGTLATLRADVMERWSDQCDGWESPVVCESCRAFSGVVRLIDWHIEHAAVDVPAVIAERDELRLLLACNIWWRRHREEPVERLDEAVVRAERAEAQVQTLIVDRAEARAALDRVRALCALHAGRSRDVDDLIDDIRAAIDGEA